MSELNYLREQLNLIIALLDVSDEQIYESIKHHDKLEIGVSIDELYGNNYDNFNNHITTSALILGFTHFEDFLTKMIKKLLIEQPSKNRIKVTIHKFEQLGEKYKIELAEEQSKKMTFSDKVRLVENTFSEFNKDLISEMYFVNKIRNCLMHNNGFADFRLEPKFQNGQKIILSSGKIHEYGLMARSFAEELWKKFE